MVACISGDGVGLRLPAATEYEKDLDLSRASIAFVTDAWVR